MRRVHVVLIAVAILIFLAISAVLARVLSVDGAERGAITALVQAEARGDSSYVLSQLQGCDRSPSCQARVARDVAELKHSGAVSIIQLQPSAGFSLTGTVGTARVAWDVGSSLPIVQCVRVRRAGNALRGLSIKLLAISLKIKSDHDCPSRF